MSYSTTPLNSSHKKKNFACGKDLLDNYLHTQAKQDVKRKLSACFILADDEQIVKGYYTLSSAAIDRTLLPDQIKSKLPPAYIDLPATLLGRLAVDHAYKGQGLGKLLLIDALKRSFDASINSVGSMAVIVDPLDAEAVRFYENYGFIRLSESDKMFLPMDTISQLFSQP
ncbi:MAG TPA: GNAT family N-acetyltransferase [Puia sp.]|nr:GNAT family N-acetyltransferase [Puia sp.]